MKKIPTPKMSEILRDEFMSPLNISAYELAKSIHVPVSIIQDILHDRRDVTIDTSIRLGRFFGVSNRYFINLQNDIGLRNAIEQKCDEYNKINPFAVNHPNQRLTQAINAKDYVNLDNAKDGLNWLND